LGDILRDIFKTHLVALADSAATELQLSKKHRRLNSQSQFLQNYQP
jgi:hypothetical protein